MVEQYWGPERTYHHTAPIHMVYALAAGLDLVFQEGLDHRIQRHRDAHEALAKGLDAMGLGLLPPEGARLPMLNAVVVPDGCDEGRLRQRLLNEHRIEVGAGLGELKGKVIRVGIMGHNANRRNVVTFLGALEECLRNQQQSIPAGAGVAAALS